MVSFWALLRSDQRASPTSVVETKCLFLHPYGGSFSVASFEVGSEPADQRVGIVIRGYCRGWRIAALLAELFQPDSQVEAILGCHTQVVVHLVF